MKIGNRPPVIGVNQPLRIAAYSATRTKPLRRRPMNTLMARSRARILPLNEERRRHQRVRIDLLGRLMLENRQEYACRIINMSPGGAAVMAETPGKIGERVIAYVDHLGRLEGKIAREFEGGFAMSIGATPRKREKLAAQLTWLANRQILNLSEDR